MTGKRVSRRQLLKAGLVASATGLAGCSGTGTAGSRTPSNPVFEETSVSGSDLVVKLQKDRDVDTVNLIGPAGKLFDSVGIEAGVTAVEFGLFDLDRGWHYEPGKHSLVAVRNGEQIASWNLDLTPDLEIVDVQQYTGGRPTPSNRANLLVSVENTGTGPTWVYYVGYENSLDRDANHIPTNSYAKTSPMLNLEKPEQRSDVILQPDASVDLLGNHSPFLLSKEDRCDGHPFDMEVIVLAGGGEDARKQFRATLSGDPVKANFRATCSEIRVEPNEVAGPE
jgi:hypothetical protein